MDKDTACKILRDGETLVTGVGIFEVVSSIDAELIADFIEQQAFDLEEAEKSARNWRLQVAKLSVQYREQYAELRAKLDAAEISIKDRETRAEYSGNCAAKLAKELESLKNAHTSQYNDLQMYITSCRQLVDLKEAQFKQIDELKAHNALLVEALEEIQARCELRKLDDDAHYENYYEAREALDRYRAGEG